MVQLSIENALHILRMSKISISDFNIRNEIEYYLCEEEEGGYLENKPFENETQIKNFYNIHIDGSYNLDFTGQRIISPQTWDEPEYENFEYSYRKKDLEINIDYITITFNVLNEEFIFSQEKNDTLFSQKEWEDFWKKANEIVREKVIKKRIKVSE